MAADDESVLAVSVPAEWVRDQLKLVGKGLRGEAEALKQLEERIYALRTATQAYADACDKGEESILPTLDKVKRARETKLAQIQQVQEARIAVTRSEIMTASEIGRLTALTPDWVTGVSRDQIDESNEPIPVAVVPAARTRANRDTARTKR